MTEDETVQPQKRPILQDILTTVRSIDRNVEEILDRLEDHLADIDYRRDVYEHAHGYEPINDYDAE